MITPDLQLDLYRYTTDVLRARAEYEAHPSVAEEMDWCPACVWPCVARQCDVCTKIIAARKNRERKRRRRARLRAS